MPTRGWGMRLSKSRRNPCVLPVSMSVSGRCVLRFQTNYRDEPNGCWPFLNCYSFQLPSEQDKYPMNTWRKFQMAPVKRHMKSHSSVKNKDSIIYDLSLNSLAFHMENIWENLSKDSDRSLNIHDLLKSLGIQNVHISSSKQFCFHKIYLSITILLF